MKGYSPKLPLMLDPTDGYRLNRTLKEVVKQNIKMLILTSPGERIMRPTFGVGLYNFLFELNTQMVRADINSRIRNQIKIYMPFVVIRSIEFSPEEGFDVDKNVLSLVLNYSVPSLKETDVLRINID
tara:strand:- start:728 stop:1108 length:381 start_codon:yes stop_codon:yes gene_type:complete